MKKILAAMLLILIVILAAGAGYQWWSSGNGNKKQFQKSQEIFGNPLMGYAPSAWYENVSEDISLLYMDITWAELEPGFHRRGKPDKQVEKRRKASDPSFCL